MTADLHRIGIKFFNKTGQDVPLTDFIPIFHHWIQDKKLDDLLIDVADYSHVPAGPGTMLIAHEGNYAVDETGGRRGFLYYSKHEVPGATLADRLAVVCRRNLAACKLLEEDEETKDRMSLDYGQIEIFSNDRLHGPNTDETWAEFEPVLKEFLEKLFPGTAYDLEHDDSDPRERFRVTVSLKSDAEKAEELLARL
ncbi:MAG: hypothetical protein U5P41_05640 [Gammaproteobacteria bacterium]|nr:hypothetical protein [Gammaproteobacteria bacterium]